ncbi:ABC transporter permease [Lagierella sp.]|uniref:ABC transporter permease n=1 Tax=Lagierella sp. TaxID=2849657 RepID=UPI0026356531|nr:ABC transporter permease [Lagierella sp.]
MNKFLLKRFIQSIVIFFGVVFITFLLMNIIPGNAATALIGEKTNAKVYERVLKELELDKPVAERFFSYISKLLEGDLGKSIIMNQSVAEIIKKAFPNTLKLSLAAMMISWGFGILFGVLAAMYQGTFVDRLLMFNSILGISMPTFWIAILLQYIFAYKLKLVPISGFGSIKELILPAIVLGWSFSGEITRVLKENIKYTMKEGYVDTARIKGLSKFQIIIRHALKSSMLPIVTIMILQFTSLLGGAMITETIFGIPGLGTLSISALTNRDLPLLQGTILLATSIIILGNFLSDILYSIIDPRIRVE